MVTARPRTSTLIRAKALDLVYSREETPSDAEGVGSETTIARYAMSLDCEADFLLRLESGEDRLFEHLVREHGAQVRRYCRRFALDSDEEQDLVQATWVLVWERRRGYTGRGSFAGWVHRLTRTVCTRAARRRFDTVNVDDETTLFDAVPVDAQDAIERQTLEDERLDLIMALPKRRRAIVLARLCAGLSTEETAAMLQCRPGTVKATLHKALKSLVAAGEKITE
jgi:RNA polymerase sigma-70 factor (ECF subfamily)